MNFFAPIVCYLRGHRDTKLHLSPRDAAGNSRVSMQCARCGDVGKTVAVGNPILSGGQFVFLSDGSVVFSGINFSCASTWRFDDHLGAWTRKKDRA